MADRGTPTETTTLVTEAKTRSINATAEATASTAKITALSITTATAKPIQTTTNF